MRTIDAAVIGGGPAGLAAASLLAANGARTVLFDEQPAPGGQIYRGVERVAPALLEALGREYAHGGDLVRRFRASGAAYLALRGRTRWVSVCMARIFLRMNSAAPSLARGLVVMSSKVSKM